MRESFRTRRPPPDRLLIFARVPELGRVKTRLAREIGDDRALVIYRAMLRDLLVSIGPSNEDMEVEILWTAHDEVSGERLRAEFDGFPLSRQAGTTLGDRLAVAISERIYFYRAEKVVAIGTDDPALTRESVARAFRLLDSCEWVLGPAADGGYYLIGCRGASFASFVFRDMEWGTDAVLAATVQRIRELGGTLAMLPRRIDIDFAEDLRAYSTVAGPDSGVANVLRSWGWVE